MTKGSVTIAKQGEGCVNEDAVISKEGVIGVSDGAGGGGLFADKWSAYLLENLPNTPLLSADEADGWLETIWETFYNECEQTALKSGGLLLDKFYDEGSFATLAAVWRVEDSKCVWVSYGDSVAFHYNRKTKILEHSFGRLAEFNNPPYLINCKDELNKQGFHSGEFLTDEHSEVFVASDALAHYIIMMYEIMNHQNFEEELLEAMGKHSKNENYIKAAMNLMPFDFETDVLDILFSCVNDREKFVCFVRSLVSSSVLALDDYSLAVM